MSCIIVAEDGNKGGELAKAWEASIRQALMPVVHVTGPQSSSASAALPVSGGGSKGAAKSSGASGATETASRLVFCSLFKF